MNPDAKPFISQPYELEQKFFDELENNFVQSNKWLFEEESDSEYIVKTKDNKNILISLNKN